MYKLSLKKRNIYKLFYSQVYKGLLFNHLYTLTFWDY